MFKRTRYIISVVVIVALLLNLMQMTAYASNKRNNVDGISVKEFDESRGVYKEIAVMPDSGTICYLYCDDYMSYCSQMSSTGVIQFSYILESDNTIRVSDIYQIDEVIPTGVLSGEVEHTIDSLNTHVVLNIDTFACAQILPSTKNLHVASENTRSDDGLADAMDECFGESYVNTLRATTYKNYENQEYVVRVYESKLKSHTTPLWQWFDSGTVITAVIAWAAAGNFGWIAALKAVLIDLILEVVPSVINNGLEYTIHSFTAKKTEVTCNRTRSVRVDGYSGSPYWAGKTEKIYLFKGVTGWTEDVEKHGVTQHDDFGNLIALMDRGFDLFVDGVLS